MNVIEAMNEQVLFIVDGNAIAYRTWHMLTHKHKRDDPGVGLFVYAYMSQIRSFIAKYIPHQNVVPFIVWDTEDSRMPRVELYPDYKGKRKPPTREFREARSLFIEALIELRPRLGLYKSMLEADDLIAIMTQEDMFPGKKIFLCTRDEDLTQLINERVSYFNPFKKEIMDLEGFWKHYGFSPTRMGMYKALMGDEGDNWKGVVGIGPKTAKPLMQKPGLSDYETVTEIYKNLPNEKKKATFIQGLRLCGLPWEGADLPQIKEYLSVLSSVEDGGDWEAFFHRFEIRDKDKVWFPLGQLT